MRKIEELIERVSGLNGEVVAIFDRRVEVHSDGTESSLRYEEVRSIRLDQRGPFAKLVLKDQSGRTVEVGMWHDDGRKAKNLIKDRRWAIKMLRETGFASMEDFEAKAAELGKRLGMR